MTSINYRLLYFHWLCSLIERSRIDKGYREFNCELHKIDFVAIVPNDDNRTADGVGLRDCFALESDSEFRIEQNSQTCSVFEMLIGVAQRMNFILSGPREEDKTAKWYWVLIQNLGLKIYTPNDPEIESKKRYNQVVIDKFLKRDYRLDGRGGLFPLGRRPLEDQRRVEIWYQMMAYINEMQLD